MLIRKIQQINYSLLLNLPSHICDMLGIKKGDNVRIDVEGKKIIIESVEPAKETTDSNQSQEENGT